MDEIACQVIAFTDDGVGVATEQMMEAAMLKAKPLGKMIVAHCEDMALTAGGFIHDGEYARAIPDAVPGGRYRASSGNVGWGCAVQACPRPRPGHG